MVTENNEVFFVEFKKQMESTFEMSDLGTMKHFLGMEVYQSNSGIFITQAKYAKNVLKRFKLESSKEVTTPLVLHETKDEVQNLINPLYIET